MAWSGWSIFRAGGGSPAAATWAADLLEAGGWPQTPTNLQVIYDWELSEGGGGTYNPLNTTLDGGNYSTISQGLQATVRTLQSPGYAPIVAQLKRGSDYQSTVAAIWNSPWDAGHYGMGASWATSQYPAKRGPISGVQGAKLSSFSLPPDATGLVPQDVPGSAVDKLIPALGAISEGVALAQVGIPNFLHRLGLMIVGVFCIGLGLVVVAVDIFADVARPVVRGAIPLARFVL